VFPLSLFLSCFFFSFFLSFFLPRVRPVGLVRFFLMHVSVRVPFSLSILLIRSLVCVFVCLCVCFLTCRSGFLKRRQTVGNGSGDKKREMPHLHASFFLFFLELLPSFRCFFVPSASKERGAACMHTETAREIGKAGAENPVL